jgi:hypothetical protein
MVATSFYRFNEIYVQAGELARSYCGAQDTFCVGNLKGIGKGKHLTADLIRLFRQPQTM